MEKTATLQVSTEENPLPHESHMFDVKFYTTSDGLRLAVACHPESLNERTLRLIDETLAVIDGPTYKADKGNQTIVIMPTQVFVCNDEWIVPDMTPLYTSGPASSHEDALAEMGYEIR